MRRSFATALLVAGFALSGCSVPSNAPTEYDAQTEENFLLGGTKSAPEAGDYDPDAPTDVTTVPTSECQCRYDWIVEHIPYDSDQRHNDPAFADYDGPTFESLDDDAGAGDALPKNILDDLAEACPPGEAPATSTTAEGD